MRRTLRILGTIVIVLATAGPAAAILNGTPDTAHPYVGILVTTIDGQKTPVCSGFLVTSTAFVTAAHCVDDLGDLPAYVSFDRRFTSSSTLVHGTAVRNPDLSTPHAHEDTNDLAVVVLDSPVTNRGYADLPGVDVLGTSAKKDSLTVVGYGTDGFVRGGGPPAPNFSLTRTSGDARISKVDKSGFNLRMSSGICYGDSGGPVLLGDSDVVVGINSYVNSSKCTGNANAYRLDTVESLAFLGPYL
jgi:secreted trypsin-like serine protease